MNRNRTGQTQTEKAISLILSIILVLGVTVTMLYGPALMEFINSLFH